MYVKPHVTRHNDGTTSAKLNVVEQGGLEVGDLYALANALIKFAKADERNTDRMVSRYALWFTSRTAKTNLPVAEATKLLKAAEAADHDISIEDTVGYKADGTTYVNRYAGRIKIGPAIVRETNREQAPLSSAAQAFLKG